MTSAWSEAAAASSWCLGAFCPEHRLEGGAASPQLRLRLAGTAAEEFLRCRALPLAPHCCSLRPLTDTHSVLAGHWLYDLQDAGLLPEPRGLPRRLRVLCFPAPLACALLPRVAWRYRSGGDDLEIGRWRRLLLWSLVLRRSRWHGSSWTTAKARTA
jgi:hypothetical protein